MHNAQYTLFALRALREDGWKLPREGLSSRVRHVIAVVVFFSGRWYDLCVCHPHIQTKKHIKYRRALIGELPADSPNGPAQSQWTQMFSRLDSCSFTAALQKDNLASDQSMPLAKRATCANAGPSSSSSSSSSSVAPSCLDQSARPPKRPRTEAPFSLDEAQMHRFPFDSCH